MFLNSNILLFQRIIPFYRVSVLKQLYERFGIITCYSDEAKNSSINSVKSIDFPALRINRFYYWTTTTTIIQNPLKPLIRYKPNVVISEGSPSYITLWLLFLCRLLFDFKLVIWTHGIRNTEIKKPFSNIRGIIQLMLLNWSDAIIVYSEGRAKILKDYLKNPNKVFVARNCLDTDRLKSIYNNISSKGKDKIKEELGFKSRFNLIFIGRLLPKKEIGQLVHAFLILSNHYDICLHIIGTGPEEEELKLRSKGNQNVIFHGSLYDEEKTGKMLYASDLMVMPGNVGLSIIHSFSFGCPVVAYKSKIDGWPYHGPEIEYLKNQVNGILVEGNVIDLSKSLIMLLENPNEIKKLSENALKTAYREATITKFLDGFEALFKFLESLR